MGGYTGKILRINLTSRKFSTIDTADYEEWGGGHGIGSAIFWDIVPDKTIDGFDPGNVITIMTSPLTGTMAVAASARTELQGIGVQSYPTGWFTRSGFGGRFGAMLKFAGWDGLVIEGRAESPVWIDIRNGEATIRDAGSWWGMDTWQTQQLIWQEVSGQGSYGDWIDLGSAQGGARTTQRPAVLCIGQAGENLCRVASLIHDAGNSSGQGGFGAVWGSKNLKAISVIGTGNIAVSDPKALLEARQWLLENFTFRWDEYDDSQKIWATMPSNLRSFPSPLLFWGGSRYRPQSCMGCQAGCRARYNNGVGNESSCKASLFYLTARVAKGKKEDVEAERLAGDLVQKYGINAGELETGIAYLKDLYKMGVLGKGKKIDSDLPFENIGGIEFAEKLLYSIAYREGIGDDIAEGFARAAERWGRLEEDLQTGLLNNCHWGLPMHYDPRVSLEWGYGTVLGDRDINEHGLCPLYMIPTMSGFTGSGEPLSADEFVRLFSEKMVPYNDDPMMLDYSDTNMYSEHVAKLVAWHRHYSRFWIQSALFCDLQFPDFFNWAAQDYRGPTGEAEPKFFQAVTGTELTFAESIELGRKIWNLDNAIWALQGRHRDQVQFADYIYELPAPDYGTFKMPVNENGQWTYALVGKRSIDRSKFEEFKTRYYALEGWDQDTGWPKRSTLESLGLKSIADELEREGKLGKE